jgi:preprotein translocase subunit SecA
LPRANEVLGNRLFGKKIDYLDKENTAGAAFEDVVQMVLDAALENYNEKCERITANGINFADIERMILLDIVDKNWMNHIDDMVQLRQGIGLRGYAQRDPLVDYRREAIDMFNHMIETINEHAVLWLFKIDDIKKQEPRTQKADLSASREAAPVGPVSKVDATAPTAASGSSGAFVNSKKTVGRNDPCPCGSGKKFKNCHGA